MKTMRLKRGIIRVLILLVGGLLNVYPSLGQETPGLRERAERLFAEYQYARAVPLYLKLADRKSPRLSDLERLAESYALMNQYENAQNWYTRVTGHPEASAETLLRYAEILKQNAQYAEAKKRLQQYAERTGDRAAVALEIAGCDSALHWLANPTTHKITNQQALNTGNAEFAAFPVKEELWYAAEESNPQPAQVYGWTGNAYLRVFSAGYSASGIPENPKKIEADFNKGEFHLGPVSSNAAGDVLYLTRTYSGDKGEISRIGSRKYRTHNLELLIYRQDEQGNWQEEAFAYNDASAYSLGQASLSPDEKVLFFSSDMPGGFGGTDIWFSRLQEDGSWGAPENAGPKINTDKDELFPSVAPDGSLYFSSNGQAGMGGLDIFHAQGEFPHWDTPKNMGFPVNSAGDDFAFTITELGEQGVRGFLSSNRKGGEGNDDIYAFNFQKPKIILALRGITYDKTSGALLEQTQVTLLSNGREVLGKQSTAQDGVFFFELDPDMDYKVLGQKTSYYSDSASVSTQGIKASDTLFAALYLEPLFEVGKTFQLENIHYDFDKHNIRKDAAEILDELIVIMRDNPTLRIELSSHTDSRGSDSYNLALSQRRAQAAVDYLVSRGIARDRMEAAGYGETRLLNHCGNGVACSIDQHQANRRTEVTVLSF